MLICCVPNSHRQDQSAVRGLAVRLRRATAVDVGAIAMSRPLDRNKQRYGWRSTLQRDASGAFVWKSDRVSTRAALPRQPQRGVIIPMLSSTINASALPSLCLCSIDPGVVNDVTASFVKCSPVAAAAAANDNNNNNNDDDDNNNNNNRWCLSAFCHCVRHFGHASERPGGVSSRTGCAVVKCVDSKPKTNPIGVNDY